MQILQNYRLLAGLSALVIAGLMGFAFYLEDVKGLEPCPLCMAQRVVFVGLAVVFVLAAAVNPRPGGRRIAVTIPIFVFCIAGMALAARQLYLQSLPPEVAASLSCGMGLEFMLDAYPFWEVVTMTLKGTGDCAEVQWVFLGLSIPGWTFVAFTGFALLAAWMIRIRDDSRDVR